MKPFYFIIQQSLLSNVSFIPPNMIWDFCVFSTNKKSWKNEIINIEYNVRKNSLKPIIFCSINVANYIIKYHPYLKDGIFLPQNPYQNGILDWNQYSSILPKKYLLNNSGHIFLFSDIPNNKNMIYETLGDNIFIRPLSPWKPFTGFETNSEDLVYDLNSYFTANDVKPYELCLVSPAQPVEMPEFRFWAIEGTAITWAPYNTTPAMNAEYYSGSDVIPSKEMINMVEDISSRLVCYDHFFVIDMCMINGESKMVEINGFSTSGWYEGINVDFLFQGIVSQYSSD